MRRFGLASTVVAACVLVAGTVGTAADDGSGAAPAPVVVELFTSQSCNSCPPADRFLAELADRRGIIALSLHVTHWNTLGWRDRLATVAATKRQRAYRWSLKQGTVYTPQMVIDGRYQEVGSRRAEVETLIDRARSEPPAVTVELTPKGPGRFRAVLGSATGFGGTADVWLFLFDHRHRVSIDGGENVGTTLDYRNVVRELTRVAAYMGEEQRLTLPARGDEGEARAGAAIVVQEPRAGRILGAAMIRFDTHGR